jgi:RNA polymerase sigma factor (sigma-70 family)
MLEKPIDDQDDQDRALDRRYRKALLSFFYRRLGDRADAEDLTQEVFVRLINVRKSGEVKDTEALIFTIAANLLRDRQRRASRWRMSYTSAPDKELAQELAKDLVENRGPERVLVGKEDLAAVIAALDELDERTRHMFILFRLENVKQRDIALSYGVSQSTVEREITKALLHLAARCTTKKG